jgi:hypothetical protein
MTMRDVAPHRSTVTFRAWIAASIASVLPCEAAFGQGQGGPPVATPAAGSGESTTQDPKATEVERQKLEARIRELEQRVDGLERGPVAPVAIPRTASREGTHTTPEGFWALPGTEMALKVGGYVKLDVIHDFNEIGNELKFATQTIAVPEASASRTTFSPYETRLNLDVRGPVGEHAARAFVEGDFFGGGGGSFELRHAYFELGGFLAGQTWTTYMDLSSRPQTLDFEGPDGELFVRQPMVRWTQPFADRSSFSLAFEGSSQDITPTGSFGGGSTTPLPDLTGNVRLEGEGRHLQVSGVLRYLDFEGDQGTPDSSALGFGVALSGKTEVGAPGRRLMAQVSYGEGSARYNQAMRGTGSDAVLDAQGDLEALPVVAAVLGYEHDWSERWTSTFVGTIAQVDNSSTQAATAIEKIRAASVNLVWRPYPAFQSGVEYLFGMRENADGQDGVAHRVMFSFRFVF